jgi:glycerophosphoinositol glycerophosphodiesterase
MKMLQTPLKDLIITSLVSVAAFYGSWSLLTEILRTILPFGIILALILFCSGYFLRVPAPNPDVVEAIVGKDPHLVTTNDDNYVMKTVAHRGAGLDAPENSLAAFNLVSFFNWFVLWSAFLFQCNDKGCDAIEFDITLTKDDVPVVFHDDTLKRMTDLNLKISEHKWADLSGVDISVKHLFKWVGGGLGGLITKSQV